MQNEKPEPRGWLLHGILFAVAWAPGIELLRVIFTGGGLVPGRLAFNFIVAMVVGPLFFRIWARRLPPEGEEEQRKRS